MRGLDGARGELDDALVVPGARALLVLVGGQAEEQDARDAERGALAGLRTASSIDSRSMPGIGVDRRRGRGSGRATNSG